MKTAISVPDEIFDRAERRAHELGMSRSEFYARAAERYLDELAAEAVTAQVNAVVDQLESADEAAAAAVDAGRGVLDAMDDEW